MTADDILDDRLKSAIIKLRKGAKTCGEHMTKDECAILILKLKSSVDVSRVISALHEVISQTLAPWQDALYRKMK